MDKKALLKLRARALSAKTYKHEVALLDHHIASLEAEVGGGSGSGLDRLIGLIDMALADVKVQKPEPKAEPVKASEPKPEAPKAVGAKPAETKAEAPKAPAKPAAPKPAAPKPATPKAVEAEAPAAEKPEPKA